MINMGKLVYLCKQIENMKTCYSCKIEKQSTEFHVNRNSKDGLKSWCIPCERKLRRGYLNRVGNGSYHKYEKTHKGFLMRLFRNMQSRIYGIQAAKFHLYKGKTIGFTRHEFYDWALSNDDFYRLFDEYKKSGYDRKLAPSIDRIDSSRGYHFNNIEWVTHSENSRRGSENNPLKMPVEVWINGKFIGEFDSIQQAADATQLKYANVYNRATGRVNNNGDVKVIRR